MKTREKFPKKLFVKMEHTDGESYFVADADVVGLVDVGEKRKIGIYQLVEIGEIEGVVHTRGISK